MLDMILHKRRDEIIAMIITLWKDIDPHQNQSELESESTLLRQVTLMTSDLIGIHRCVCFIDKKVTQLRARDS